MVLKLVEDWPWEGKTVVEELPNVFRIYLSLWSAADSAVVWNVVVCCVPWFGVLGAGCYCKFLFGELTRISVLALQVVELALRVKPFRQERQVLENIVLHY